MHRPKNQFTFGISNPACWDGILFRLIFFLKANAIRVSCRRLAVLCRLWTEKQIISRPDIRKFTNVFCIADGYSSRVKEWRLMETEPFHSLLRDFQVRVVEVLGTAP
ncbi:putative translation initiation factor [Trichinella spiralis]|uniref:Translation initiation factor n=1 Tax=Trichinella spiralis TaxID=6334 RepID=A0ABR3KK32_TRISP